MVTLSVKRRSLGSKDAHGNPAPSFADPIPWCVYGLEPITSERDTVDRDLSVIGWKVYAPPRANAPTELDRVVVDGDDYEVEGRRADWDEGPWSHPTAGDVVVLRRAEG